MLKAIKIRLYPNQTQQVYINKLVGCYRKVFNLCLNKKITEYNINKNNLGLSELGNYFHKELAKSEQYFYLKEHNTKVLKQSVLNLLDAYKSFFVNGNGFPKYKSKNDNKQSARFPLEAISSKNTYENSKITLIKQLKNISFECSEKDKNYLVKYKKGIKSATLTKTKSGKYFLSILIDGDLKKTLPTPTNNIIGLDLGIKYFVVCSNGEKFENLNLRKNNEKKLARLNRQLSKKQNGSNNKNKARVKLAKLHEKLNNQKENHLHSITSKLVSENQTIVIEDLNIGGMMKNHCLAKSIQNLSIYEFKRQLTYKCAWYGRDLIVVNRWFPSSKLCNCCGYKYQKLSLKERKWKCSECGKTHDRDENAAINIQNEGERIIGQRLPEFKLAEHPTMDDKEEIPLKSSGALKQEDKNLSKRNLK